MRARATNRRFVIVGGPLRSLARMGQQLLDLGAVDIHLVGYGLAPEAWVARSSSIPRPPGGLPELARTTLTDLPAEVLANLSAFDPGRSALVLAPNFYEAEMLADRRCVGTRRRVWRAIENKTTIDALWDAAGVHRPPAEVVTVDAASLAGAAARLDEGDGTVWSGGGDGSGAEAVRWVRAAADAAAAVAALASCAQARVAPFLAGIPCSIHAFVGRSGVAVFRPVEVIVLRQPLGAFLYAGVDTWWDPSSADRDQMRSVAWRVAEHLTATVGYRGSFGIDGILTGNGFLPTELNARWAAGLYPVMGPLSISLMGLLEHFIADGLDGPMDLLEEAVVTSADARRWGGATLTGRTAKCVGTEVIDGEAGPLGHVTVDGRLDVVEVRVRPRPSQFQGRSVAALGVAGFALADTTMGTDIGPLRAWDQE